MSDGITVAVTDHAVERFRQRVGTRRGGFDIKPEIAGRVSEAWAAGRVSDDAAAGRRRDRGARDVYVRDLVDRGVVFVCRHDRAVARAARHHAVGGRALRPRRASTSASPTR